jgi:3-dehydroquinate synthase
MSISDIFRKHGESYFRKLEMNIVAEVAKEEGLVISTGGGVPTFEENLKALRSNGLLFYLRTSPIAVWKRIKDATDRPLLDVSDRFTRIVELLESREPFYRRADIIVHTDKMTPDEVASQIAAWASAIPQGACAVPVCLNERTYHIVIGNEFYDSIPKLLTAAGLKEPFVLLTDEIVFPLHAQSYARAFEAHDKSLHIITVPPGEMTKSLDYALRLYDKLVEFDVPRDGTLIALGGGVVTDLGGFVAATYMRGIALVNAPTTLLGQIDAAIGGKVGVDHPRAKNLIGCFYQPRLVIADISTLRTLPERAYREGFAEAIKYGVIADEGLFDFLERNSDALLSRDQGALMHIIRRCCEIKARIVELDEEERSDKRALLNYGHTFGHAIEVVTGYRQVLHGEAVAVGMVAAAHLSCMLGICSSETVERQTEVLRRYGLPTSLTEVGVTGISAWQVYNAMALDKKRRGKTLRFILPKRIGEAFVTDKPIDEQLLIEVINAVL